MTIDVIKVFPNEWKFNLDVPSSMNSSPRLPVRRSLFGDVNHEECMDFLNKELNQITQEKMKEWNFDFVNEKPLEDSSSLYEWTPVQPNEVIPKAYALSRLPYLSTSINNIGINNISEQDNLGTIEQNNVCRTSIELESRLEDQITISKPKLTQKSIDDYVKSKKRTRISTLKNYCKSGDCNHRYHPPVTESLNKKLRLSPC